MRMTSVFREGETIPPKYTCEGAGTSPPLAFHDVPHAAQSLALIMDDPDVPASVRSDRMWDHWVVFNIPPSTKSVDAGASPPGVQGKNTGRRLGYYPPCPPDREHRYFFKLYALDCMLTLPQGASKHQLEQAMQGHIIAECGLMGRYEKGNVR